MSGDREAEEADAARETTSAASTARPLRRDAELNRRRILQAGREVFAARGLQATLNMAEVMRRRLMLTGSTLRPRSNTFKALLAQEIAANAWPFVESGQLRPVMDQTFPLAQAAAAHARMEAGEHIGKIVLGAG